MQKEKKQTRSPKEPRARLKNELRELERQKLGKNQLKAEARAKFGAWGQLGKRRAHSK